VVVERSPVEVAVVEEVQRRRRLSVLVRGDGCVTVEVVGEVTVEVTVAVSVVVVGK